MKKLFISLFLISTLYSSFAQKLELGLVFGFGPGYFIKNNYLHNQISRNKFFGVNLSVTNKSKVIIFNPSLIYSYEKYIVKVPYNVFCGITQSKFGLNLDMLMKLSKHTLFRIGLNFNRIDNSFIEISYDLYNSAYRQISFSNSHFSYSDNSLYNGYTSNRYQVGIRSGMSFPVYFLKQEMKLDITLDHSISNIVNDDYYYTNPYGAKTKVISKQSTPTKLLIGLEIKLVKPKKKKKEND